MNATKIRKQLREIQAAHEELGDTYLELCHSSGVDPLPVVWHTFPPCLEGETSAYVMFDHDAEEPGIDVHAESRAELAHAVFLRVLSIRCVN